MKRYLRESVAMQNRYGILALVVGISKEDVDDFDAYYESAFGGTGMAETFSGKVSDYFVTSFEDVGETDEKVWLAMYNDEYYAADWPEKVVAMLNNIFKNGVEVEY